MTLFLRTVSVAVLLAFQSVACAAGINDTGQSLCHDQANSAVACSYSVGGDAGVNARQDARYGRDAARRLGRLTKIGGGDRGFDYSKISNDGSTLEAAAALGSGALDWACTKDNVTGLIWEIKSDVGLRSSAHTCLWYSTDSGTNGGDPGATPNVLVGNTCGSQSPAAPYECDTEKYVADVNAVGLCAASDWRLPTYRELLSIVNAGNANPAIDSSFFPNTVTVGYGYWTRSTDATYSGAAWAVNFADGNASSDGKAGRERPVRLVRGGP